MKKHTILLAWLLWFMSSSLTIAAPRCDHVIVIGAWERTQSVFEHAASELGMSTRFFDSAEVEKITQADLAKAEVVFVLNLSPLDALKFLNTLAETKSDKKLKMLALDHRDSQKGLIQAGWLSQDENIKKYWRYNGKENLRRMLIYTRIKHFGAEGEVLPPVVVQESGVYHPATRDLFTDIKSFLAWGKSQHHFVEGAPKIAITVQQSFIVSNDTKVFDAVAMALEKRGINVAIVFSSSQDQLATLLGEFKPDLLIDDGHASPSVLKGAGALSVPQMKEIPMLRSTIADWEKSPLGLSPQDVSLHLLTQEVYGIIEPIVVGGLVADVGGYRVHEPIPDRVDRLADRAMAWLTLKSKKNAEKKIAIIYYNKYLGQGDLARGSPSGAFLDGPESIVRLLRAMKAQGYAINRIPKDGAELVEWLKKDGRNIGSWAAGDLAKLVQNQTATLLPQRTYDKWFQNKLSDDNRKNVIEKFGPSPGELMVWTENQKKMIVLPKIDLGHVILMPQPARGPDEDEKLLHSRDIPPPHQYLAMYWWLQEEFKADAVIHFGTHGSELLLPLKAAGLSKNDYGDICLGNMPNITPWVIDNAAEATLAKRRSYAVLIDHLTPPIVVMGMSSDLRNLDEDIDKFRSLDAGTLKEKYRKSITEASKKAELTGSTAELLSDLQVTDVAEKLHQIYNQIAPVKLHVLGQQPEERHLIPFLTNMLSSKFLDKLDAAFPKERVKGELPEEKKRRLHQHAEKIVGDMVRKGLSADEALRIAGVTEKTLADPAKFFLARITEYLEHFAKTTDEIDNTLHALEGKFIPPGPANDPVRNPSVIPTGRNMYAVNPEEIPTKQAWEVAVTLVDELLKTRKIQKIAFDLNAFETMRDFGVMEAQIFYLMGTRPIWDANNVAVDVEIMPRTKLGRPRIDAFIAISGTMRDNFPSRILLIDKAARMVAALDEPENYVRQNFLKREKFLVDHGFAAGQASKFAAARIFGQKPGSYGTNILFLIPKSGSWDKEKEIADLYMSSMSYVYTDNVWGEKVDGLYEEAVRGSQLILRTWASNMMSPLSNHHVFEYTGGLNMAVKALSGKEPEIALNDVRDDPKLRNFEESLQIEMYATLFNEKWIKGMMENGYAGAGMMAELTKNTFGWKVTRSGSISNSAWDQIHDIYVKDKYKLGVTQWMDQVNPYSFQEMAATLLEAHRKGYWQTDAATIENLAKQYADSVAKHGESGGLVGGGNIKLQNNIQEILKAPGNKPLVESYTAEVARSKGHPQAPGQVTGAKMEKSKSTDAASESGSFDFMEIIYPIILGAIGIILVVWGARRKIGAPR